MGAETKDAHDRRRSVCSIHPQCEYFFPIRSLCFPIMSLLLPVLLMLLQGGSEPAIPRVCCILVERGTDVQIYNCIVLASFLDSKTVSHLNQSFVSSTTKWVTMSTWYGHFPKTLALVVSEWHVSILRTAASWLRWQT